MPLTDKQISNFRPSAKPIKLSDGGGLQCHVRPTGAKLWRLAYRFGGKQRTLDLGAYPAVGLASARGAAKAARGRLALGVDPGGESQAQADQPAPRASGQGAATRTFGAWAALLLDQKEGEGATANSMRKHAYVARKVGEVEIGARAFRDMPVVSIRPLDALAVVQAIRARLSTVETAIRARSFIGEVFGFAMLAEPELSIADPRPMMAKHAKLKRDEAKHHAAALTPASLARVLRLIRTYPRPVTRAALLLSALCAPRPGELRKAEWGQFDLTGAVWTIPPGNTKMKREHRIPLSPQAVAILRELHRVTGQGRLCFPSPRGGKPISDMTLSAGLRDLGIGQDEQSAHGFRSSFSTLANMSGLWNPDAIECALAHVDKNMTRRAYNRGDYFDERVKIMSWWGEQCDAMALGS